MEAATPLPPRRIQERAEDPAPQPVERYDSYAPTYTVPLRRLGAIEHPMIIKDLEKAIGTFGKAHSFKQVSNHRGSCLG